MNAPQSSSSKSPPTKAATKSVRAEGELATGGWLVAANPEQYSWDEAFAAGFVDWDHARSPLAQKNIRRCRDGDWVVAYQSAPVQKAVGLAKIEGSPANFTAKDETWTKVRIRLNRRFARPVTREELESVAPTLEHFRVARPSFTFISSEEWAGLYRLFESAGVAPMTETPPTPEAPHSPPAPETPETPPENEDAREAADRARFADFLEMRRTPTVEAILQLCTVIAEERNFSRSISTGILLAACEQVGRAAATGGDWNAAVVLARALEPERFALACTAYFNRYRRARESAASSRHYATKNFAAVCHEAQRLAGEQEVGARHLVVALLSIGPTGRQPSSAWSLLHEAGGDRHRLLRTLLDELIDDGFPAEREVWMAERQRLGRTGAIIAGYAADQEEGVDCLDLDDDVNAMASLIVARGVEPPLAIGVFGPWGSGKSFFLRSLRQAIKRTAASTDTNYWSNIVQIEFNAWHFVDANLWASLAAHILQKLGDRTKANTRKPEEQEACRAALALLKLADERLQQATSQELTLKAGFDAAQTKTEQAIATIATSETAIAAQLARDLTAELNTEQVLNSIPGAQAALGGLQQIDGSLRNIGKSGKELRQKLEGFALTGARLDLLWSALLQGRGSRTLLPWAIVAVAVSALLWRLFHTEILAVLAPLASVAAGAAQWVKRQHAQIGELLEPLDKVRLKIDESIAAAEAARHQKIAELKAGLEAKRAELQQATAQRMDAQKALADARQAASDTVSGKTIDAFVAQRIGSGEYQKHLGLVALVRSDFEKLGSMILTHNGIQSGNREEKLVAELLKNGVNIENLGINRIVLYIDDLDRCPPPRVIEVLQAIHLLLAFPVFVVVVAVDSRWMKRSLAQQYPLLVGTLERANGHGDANGDRLTQPYASPEDYLEKIFQIPYWVQPMTSTACGKLMRTLTEVTPAPKKQNEQQQNREEKGEGKPPDEKSRDPAGGESEQSRQEQPSTGGGTAGETGTTGGTPKSDDPRKITGSDGDPAKKVVAAERLQLSAGERSGMEDLAMLVGRSPRAAKRFVNTYRVIRSALSESQLEMMRRERGYDSILFVLALNTGAPALVEPFSARLAEAAESEAMTEILHELARETLATSNVPVAREAASRVAQWAAAPTTRWTSLTVRRVQKWMPRVRQFSFSGEGEAAVVIRSQAEKAI